MNEIHVAPVYITNADRGFYEQIKVSYGVFIVCMHATVEPPYSSHCMQPTDIQTQLHDQSPSDVFKFVKQPPVYYMYSHKFRPMHIQ